ncbi:MAG: hypothetical protein WAW79_13280 [Steroidobacteraceae bacterium]
MTEGENRYLDLINCKSAEEAYAEVKKLASNLSDREHLIRSCIFDLHAAIEIDLRRVFYHTFHSQLFLTDDEEENRKVEASFEKMVDRLGFMDMFRVLRPVLLSWPYPDLESIEAINETRGHAAHAGTTQKVKYKGRNPFQDGDCFAQMYFDVWAIKQSMAKFFDKTIEQPKVVLRRYIDRYGPGLL